MNADSSNTTRRVPVGSGPVVPAWMWPTFGVATAVFFFAMGFDIEPLRFTFKALPVLTLAVGVYLTEPSTRFRRLIALGLLFGAIGDFEFGYFELTLAAFLVSHLIYITAFVGVSRAAKPALAIPYVAVGIGLTIYLAEGAGDLLIPVAIYAVVISIMGWRAAALVGECEAAVSYLLAIGATLFIVSDAILAINRFHSEVTAADWLIMVPYLAAQGLIAVGAVRHRAGVRDSVT
ncbi:MAG: lysoplasmalogenase [Actinomycetota bacterium]